MSDRNSMRFRRAVAAVGMFSSLALLAVGCGNEATPPGDDLTNQAGADIEGTLDPAGQTLRLQVLTDPPPGYQPVPIELLGSNLALDLAAETVALDVAIHNAGDLPLFAPAMVSVGRLVPSGVTVENADVTWPPAAGAPPPPFAYGFDYSSLLGEDGVLVADETSGAKTWIFHVPGLTAFSFGARASFGMVPDLPRIAGVCFHDLNRDGLREPAEPGHPGQVRIEQPDGTTAVTLAGPDGTYGLPVSQTGLYRLTYSPLEIWDCVCPFAFSTPNPLAVVLPPDTNGAPIGFLDARFGFFLQAPNDSVPPVVFSPLPTDSLRGDPYSLIEAHLLAHVLVLRVGFSGCDPNHPFVLFMSGPFAESFPVQATIVLQHDGLGQLCEAYFERTLRFDLDPIRMRYIAEYGAPGPVQINFLDYEEGVHPFMLMPGP